MTTTAPHEGRIPWIIRPATLDDAQACGDLLQYSYSKLLAPDYTVACLDKCLPLIVVAQPELLTCKTWYVAEHPHTGDLVGCGGWTASKPGAANSDENQPHLRHFAVHPDYTRKGIASLLWKRSIEDIERSMNPFPKLQVFSTLTAESFYQSCGFKTTKAMEILLREDASFPCLLMERDP